jgi:hypothetical protein
VFFPFLKKINRGDKVFVNAVHCCHFPISLSHLSSCLPLTFASSKAFNAIIDLTIPELGLVDVIAIGCVSGTLVSLNNENNGTA